jgi:hypothetical protein
MVTVKVTFTLDEATVKRIETASQRLAFSNSRVVPEAVRDYYECLGKMSEQERKRMLHTSDEVMATIPARPTGEVRRELKEIRLARRLGGRATPVKRQN